MFRRKRPTGGRFEEALLALAALAYVLGFVVIIEIALARLVY